MEEGSLLHDDRQQQRKQEKSLARSRWTLLAKVLQATTTHNGCRNNGRSTLVPTISRELYGLFEWRWVDRDRECGGCDAPKDHQWLQMSSYSTLHFSLDLRFLVNRFSIDELTGFNNTGNVCLWPSEEVLAHYCTQHMDLFAGRRVLELGGGMTCLAGLTVASVPTTTPPLSVHCTDGNPASVDNVRHILKRNRDRFNAPVSTQILDWKSPFIVEPAWDVILCADCLFFDDGRAALVDTMFNSVTDNGLIIIVAPRRGGTLDAFLALCRGKFDVDLSDDYDRDLSASHSQKMLNRQSSGIRYNPDHNYPLLIQLRKLLLT